MGQFLLLLVVALTVGAVVFGVTVLLTGGDRGLSNAEPDGQAVPLPGTRPLAESDVAQVRFDVALRGYRMAQVDQAMRRAAYDIGYKDELINVLEAEVEALRAGRLSDADVLRRAREAAQAATAPAPEGSPAESSEIELGAVSSPGESEQASLAEHLDEPVDDEQSTDAVAPAAVADDASLAEHLDDRPDQDDHSGEPAAADTTATASTGATGDKAAVADSEASEPGAESATDQPNAEESTSDTPLPSRR